MGGKTMNRIASWLLAAALISGASAAFGQQATSNQPPPAAGPAVGGSQPDLEVTNRTGGLTVDLHLSTNSIHVGDDVLMTVTLVNSGGTNATLDRNAITAWVAFEDSQHRPIDEILLTDILCAAPDPSPLLIPPGGRVVMRVFRAKSQDGNWDGRPAKHSSVGLVMHRDYGSSCYPLESVPGEYFVRGHLLVHDPDARPRPAGVIVSSPAKLTVAR
jgi:hypothetical protein